MAHPSGQQDYELLVPDDAAGSSGGSPRLPPKSPVYRQPPVAVVVAQAPAPEAPPPDQGCVSCATACARCQWFAAAARWLLFFGVGVTLEICTPAL